MRRRWEVAPLIIFSLQMAPHHILEPCLVNCIQHSEQQIQVSSFVRDCPMRDYDSLPEWSIRNELGSVDNLLNWWLRNVLLTVIIVDFIAFIVPGFVQFFSDLIHIFIFRFSFIFTILFAWFAVVALDMVLRVNRMRFKTSSALYQNFIVVLQDKFWQLTKLGFDTTAVWTLVVVKQFFADTCRTEVLTTIKAWYWFVEQVYA